ncbi:CBS domain-containing protein [Candidatus Woesearchaeota archaeon]|nr:CBS domain-containing protein [Candidatus Woesearchaeota archaeon]
MKTGYSVGDAMTTKPVSVTSGTTLLGCAAVMDEKHVGAVVVKDDGKSIGIITEQDIVRKVVAKGINPLTEKVKDYMEKNLITIAPDKDIYDALVLMRDNNIRHLPVVQNGEMIGLLTIKDILKIQPQLFEIIVEKFEIREAARKPVHKPIKGEAICQICGNYTERSVEKDSVLMCAKCAKESG